MKKKITPFRFDEKTRQYLQDLQQVYPHKSRTKIVEEAILLYHLREVTNPNALHAKKEPAIQPKKDKDIQSQPNNDAGHFEKHTEEKVQVVRRFVRHE